MKDYLEQQDTFDDGAFIVADGAYSGEANSQMAASHNMILPYGPLFSKSGVDTGLYTGMNCIPLV